MNSDTNFIAINTFHFQILFLVFKKPIFYLTSYSVALYRNANLTLKSLQRNYLNVLKFYDINLTTSFEGTTYDRYNFL